ncbi:class I SAM-dependent methyltransferase [Nocardioides sp. P5_E3]
MTTTDQPGQQPLEEPLDEQRLMSFVFRAVDEVGATLNAALVVLGDKLGWYEALAERGPMTAEALADAAGTALPYTREWLNAQAAGSFVDYDPTTGRYTLPPEHAVALTDADSPAYLPGLFQIALGTVADSQRLVDAVRRGGGIGWPEHSGDVHEGCERFFRPSYRAHLVDSWLPAVGVADRLRAGAAVADVGCGHGASTILMASAFPASRFAGSDPHAPSIDVARRRAEEAGVADRVRFEVADAAGFSGTGFDLVATFDSLHDMGDPVGAARHVRSALADDGVWMVVEPMAGDHVEDNLTPVGRAYYGFSTLLCTPASLSQEVGLALGTQAGPARIRAVVEQAGFGSLRSAAETPFHRVMEVRVAV